MSGLSIGLSTFNSCNKAGSIPHFTQHLSRYPNDYRALTWRGRAYSIIGKTAEAKADFQKACRVSSGPKTLLAQAHIEHIDGNVKQKATILQNTTRQYPNCSEAWHELGSHTYHVEDKIALSLQYLGRANQLATKNSETKEPWYPWCNQTIGDIYFYKKQQVNEARKHYEAAVHSCNTLTIGHLGLSRCDILNNSLERAKTSFLTAKDLNPVLVQWGTFDDFRRQVQTSYTLASLLPGLFSDLLTETVQKKPETVHQQQIKQQDTSSFENVSGARFRDTRGELERNMAPTLQKPPQHSAGARFRDTRVQSSRFASEAELHPYYDRSQFRELERNMAPTLQKPPQHSAGARFRDTRVQSSRFASEAELHPYYDRSQFRELERNMAPSLQKPPQHSAGAKSRAQSHKYVSGYQGAGRSGGSRGNGGSSDGSGSDDEASTPVPRAEIKWKKIMKEAPSAKKYRGKMFYQSKSKEHWYSKIEASQRHGHEKKSYLKQYKDRGRTLELIGSIDENNDLMTGKHESRKYDVIKKSDMVGIF